MAHAASQCQEHGTRNNTWCCDTFVESVNLFNFNDLKFYMSKFLLSLKESVWSSMHVFNIVFNIVINIICKMEACPENWKGCGWNSRTPRWEACSPGNPETRKYCLQMSCTPCPSCRERSCLPVTKQPKAWVTYCILYRMQCDIVGQHTISYIDLRHSMFLLWHRTCTYNVVCQPTT